MKNVARRPALVITIDGPAGAGKSTVAHALAGRLGYVYFDTGALYRAVAWVGWRAGVDGEDAAAMEALLDTVSIRMSLDEGSTRICIDNEDVTPHLRSPVISRLASAVARLPRVRERLLPMQRRYGRTGGIVAEGRDMGTLVFPDAGVKFFLRADLDTRAERRYHETARGGYPEPRHEIRRQIEERDASDQSRAAAPLVPAADAVVIDSSSLTVDQVVENMMKWIASRA